MSSPTMADSCTPLRARARAWYFASTAAPAVAAWLAVLPAATAGQTAHGAQRPDEPVAAVRPHELTIHGHTRVDEYYWLRERESPEVIAYLEAENAYTEAMTAHTAGLRDTLYQEIRGRERQDEQSAPTRDGGWLYYTRFVPGQDYPINARRRGSMSAPEEILLDQNEAARGHGYYSGFVVPSPDHSMIAIVEDTVGRRNWSVRFRDLATGEVLPVVIDSTDGDLAWASDGRTVFYVTREPETLRSYRVWRHRIDQPQAADAMVYEEPDPEYNLGVTRTRSGEFIRIGSFQTESTEFRLIPADRPYDQPRVFAPRRDDHLYWIDHHVDDFYVVTNSGDAENFRLMRAPESATSEAEWVEVIPHRSDVLVEDATVFRSHVVISERREGLLQLRVVPLAVGAGAEHYVEFDEPAYVAWPTQNAEFDTPVLRYVYASMTTPNTWYDYDMTTRERTLVKQQEVLGGFDPARYRTERLWATARDGMRVPVSVVYARETRIDGSAPLLVYGYGSYGASMDASFSSARLSLLDRGFVYAIAHIRGGQEMGRNWYETGRLMHKMNTFTDFIDVTGFLVERGYGDADRVYAWGGSAGGLLVGAVMNLRPDLYDGVIAAVPFVDVVTTMLDETIPLTTFEYDEWGNPNEPEAYRYMLSYSPYDNVTAQAYPNLLVTTGLHDSQVQYFEPAKWVARLRARRTDDNMLLLKTEMEAGHGGPSGRERRWRDTAFQYAFLVDLARTAEARRPMP